MRSFASHCNRPLVARIDKIREGRRLLHEIRLTGNKRSDEGVAPYRWGLSVVVGWNGYDRSLRIAKLKLSIAKLKLSITKLKLGVRRTFGSGHLCKFAVVVQKTLRFSAIYKIKS